MSYKAIDFIFAEAGTGTSTAANPTADTLKFFLMLAGMGFIFYFLIIRPQSKQAKEHKAMLSALKAGDKVVTSGGIVGVVVSIKDRTVSVRSGDVKVEILKSAVSQVDRSGEGSGTES